MENQTKVTVQAFDLESPVVLKIDGQPINVDPAKLHASWLAECLAYGIRRKINDTYSASKGKEKFDLCAALAADMNAGKEKPEKLSSGKATTDMEPAEKLAFDNAKNDLLAKFRQAAKLPGGKIADLCAASPKIAEYFTDKNVWRASKVFEYIKAQAEAGKKDFLAEAKAVIEAAAEAIGEEAFDF